MKSEEFIEIIGGIDEEYLLKAREERESAKILPLKKIIALAAALIILAATATVVIAEVFNIKFDDTKKGRLYLDGEEVEYSGYSISYAPEDIKIDEFSEEVQKNFRELAINWKGLLDCPKGADCDEHAPLYHNKDFLELSEAIDYIGCERIKIPDQRFRITDISVSQSDYDISLHYWGESAEIDFSVRVTAEIDAKERQEDGISQLFYTSVGEETEFFEEYRTNANGIEYVVVYKKSEDGYFNSSYDRNLRKKTTAVAAYLVKDGILYSYYDTIKELYNEDGTAVDEISMSNIRKDEKETVEKYLKLWADDF